MIDRGLPIDQVFEAAIGIVLELNRQEKDAGYVKRATDVIGPAFLKAFAQWIVHSDARLKRRYLLDLWAFANETQNPRLLDWLKSNKHVFERAFLRGEPIETAFPAFKQFFLKHNFDMELQGSPPVFVCAMPKSGSTSFSTILAAYLDRSVADGHNRNALVHGVEADFLRAPVRSGAVIHSHLRPSIDLMCILRALSTTPIIIMRNIFDVIEARAHGETNLIHHSVFSSPAQHKVQLTLEYAVDRYALEYLSFAQQWMTIGSMINTGIFYFEDNVADWRATLQRCANTLGYEFDSAKADTVLRNYERRKEKDPQRFRTTGPAGRERQFYTPELVERVQALTRHFPDTDFSRIMTPPKVLAE